MVLDLTDVTLADDDGHSILVDGLTRVILVSSHDSRSLAEFFNGNLFQDSEIFV